MICIICDQKALMSERVIYHEKYYPCAPHAVHTWCEFLVTVQHDDLIRYTYKRDRVRSW